MSVTLGVYRCQIIINNKGSARTHSCSIGNTGIGSRAPSTDQTSSPKFPSSSPSLFQKWKINVNSTLTFTQNRVQVALPARVWRHPKTQVALFKLDRGRQCRRLTSQDPSVNATWTPDELYSFRAVVPFYTMMNRCELWIKKTTNRSPKKKNTHTNTCDSLKLGGVGVRLLILR